MANGVARLGREIELEHLLQGCGPSDDRTKAARAEQIVADAVPSREPRLAREIGLRVEEVDRIGARRILNVKGPAGQRLLQIPSAAGGMGCRRFANQGLNLGLRHGFEDAPED